MKMEIIKETLVWGRKTNDINYDIINKHTKHKHSLILIFLFLFNVIQP